MQLRAAAAASSLPRRRHVQWPIAGLLVPRSFSCRVNKDCTPQVYAFIQVGREA